MRIASVHMSYPGGATANSSAGYTGASWDNSGRTCSNCHSGGSYNPTTTITLLSGANAVTSYVPGASYTVQIKVTSASGAPKYGFDAMCVTSTTHANVNGWPATMPTGTKKTTVSSRTYVEQSSAQTATGTTPTSYKTFSIAWTAPAAGTGSVTFYAAGIAVNGTGSTSGDSPTAGVNLTVTESGTVPVEITSLRASRSGNAILVNWSVANEINVREYVVEHSTNGSDFSQIGTLPVQADRGNSHEYAFTDAQAGLGANYYRIVSVDADGTRKYSSIVTVSVNKQFKGLLLPNPAHDYVQLPGSQYFGQTYQIVSISGVRVASGMIQGTRLNTTRLQTGNYVLQVTALDGTQETFRFVKN